MKLFLVNHQNANDINAFSGTAYFMNRAIKKQVEDVLEHDLYESFTTIKKTHDEGICPTLKPMGDTLSAFLIQNRVEADYVLCIGGNSSIPYYRSPIPIAYWHDSTWLTYLHGYSDQKAFRTFKSNYENFYLWDKAAIEKADILIYSSEYVAEAVIENYKTPRSKVKVIPFGANIHDTPPTDFLQKSLQIRLNAKVLNLTFIGKDWKRKGLMTAFDLVSKLNVSGIAAKLNVIGSDHQIQEINQSPYVKNWGFIDKSIKNQFDMFEKILEETHFLIHPAISEPFGVVLCEANAYGIPVIGTEIEGLKTIVKNGINGHLFKRESFIEDSVIFFKNFSIDFQGKYTNLSKSAFDEYERRLNWDVSISELKKVLSF